MGRPSGLANLCLRFYTKYLRGCNQFQIRNNCSDQVNTNELVQKHRLPGEVCAQNQFFSVGEITQTLKEPGQLSISSEVAEEIRIFIRTQPRWEKNLTSVFPTVNFLDPDIHKEVLKQQNNAFLSLRFYLWLRSLNGFALDPVLCNLMFNRLIAAKAAKAAENFLHETKFEPEPRFLESYIVCLCENELVDKAFTVFKRLKMAGYCASLETWNSALSCAIRTKRVGIFWALYEHIIEFGVAPDVNTVGYLVLALCMDENAVEGYKILLKALEDDHVPSKIVFNRLIAAFAKSRDYQKMSAVLHIMIAKNVPPDIYTYQEVINGLYKSGTRFEGFRIFNDLKDRGYFPDRVMYTTVIDSLCKIKWPSTARKVWFEMIQKRIVPNEYTYNAFIDGLCRNGWTDEAVELYKEMLSKGYGKSSICYKSIIRAMCQNGEDEEALKLCEHMKENGISCDVSTYKSLTRSITRINRIKRVKYTKRLPRWMPRQCLDGMRPITRLAVHFLEKRPARKCVDGIRPTSSLAANFLEKGPAVLLP